MQAFVARSHVYTKSHPSSGICREPLWAKGCHVVSFLPPFSASPSSCCFFFCAFFFFLDLLLFRNARTAIRTCVLLIFFLLYLLFLYNPPLFRGPNESFGPGGMFFYVLSHYFHVY